MAGIDDLKTERRRDVDGGLNTRRGLFFDDNSQAVAMSNLVITERGALSVRKGAVQLCQPSPYATSRDLPAPFLQAGVAVGSLSNGVYQVYYQITSAIGGVFGKSSVATITLSGGTSTQSLILALQAVNVGDGFTFFDDPTPGFAVTAGVPNTIWWVKKDADTQFRAQAVTGGVWQATTPIGYAFTLSVYSGNAAAEPTTVAQPMPLRSCIWHPFIEGIFVWGGDGVIFLSGAMNTPGWVTMPYDSNALVTRFCRYQSRIYAAFLNNVMVVTDGIGKPKKLNWTADPTSSAFYVAGANPPVVLPAVADGGVGVMGAGTYIYTWTYSYGILEGDAFTTLTNESNAYSLDASGNIVGPGHAQKTAGATTPGTSITQLANRKVNITIPAAIPGSTTPGVLPESGLTYINIYRTTAGGAVYYRVAAVQLAIIAQTYADNLTDAAIVADGRTIPNDGFKIPNDPPPFNLYMLTQFTQRLFAVQGKNVVNAVIQLLRLKMTNTLQFSQVGATGYDYWPAAYTLACGESEPITALVNYRGYLYVFKEQEIGVVEGDGIATAYSYSTLWSGVGAMEGSTYTLENAIYFWDQSQGPMKLDGFTVTAIGYDSVQQDWVNNFRGRVIPREVTYDATLNMLRWAFSSLLPGFYTATPTLPLSLTAFNVEYVYDVKANRWPAPFQGATSGIYTDRVIRGQCRAIVSAVPNYRAFDNVYVDYFGRVCRDMQTTWDLDTVVGLVQIPFSATFPFFFHDNAEMEKIFRYLYVLLKFSSASAADAIRFYVTSLRQLNQGGTPVLLATYLGNATYFGIPIQHRRSIPKQFDGVNTVERGLQLSLNGETANPLVLYSVSLKAKDVSDIRLDTTVTGDT